MQNPDMQPAFANQAAAAVLPLGLLGAEHQLGVAPLLRKALQALIEAMAGKEEPRREGKRDAPSVAPKGFPLNGKLPLSRVATRLLSTM